MFRRCGVFVLLGLPALVLLLSPLQAQQAGSDPVATSADGKLQALGKDRAILIQDGQTQQVLRKLIGHGDRITSLAISPDGKLLASGSLDKTVACWDLATGRELLRLRQPVGVVGLSFAPDGRTLTTVGTDQSTRRWDVGTGKLVSQ